MESSAYPFLPGDARRRGVAIRPAAVFTTRELHPSLLYCGRPPPATLAAIGPRPFTPELDRILEGDLEQKMNCRFIGELAPAKAAIAMDAWRPRWESMLLGHPDVMDWDWVEERRLRFCMRRRVVAAPRMGTARSTKVNGGR